MSASSQSHTSTHGPRMHPLWLVMVAYAVVYVVWGSTYLGIRFAIETIPPFLMAGSRFLAAGLILYGCMRMHAPAPTTRQWRAAIISGFLLLLGGNGLVTFAEKSVPSGVAALIVALTPVWIVLLDWLRPGGARPKTVTTVGLVLGFAGVSLLTLAKDGNGHPVVEPIGGLALLVATLSWAGGVIYSRHAARPASIVQLAGMQMIAGGSSMLLVAVLRGEAAHFQPHMVSAQSAQAWLYLMAVGGLVSFTTYAWLVKVSTPAMVSTIAYVNPLIAVILGAWMANESLSEMLLAAGLVIVIAVALMTIGKGGGRQDRAEPATAEKPAEAT